MAMPPLFATESVPEILAFVRERLAQNTPTIAFRVCDPDRGAGRFAGERADARVHRPLRVWVDLADRMRLRLHTPRTRGEGLIEIRLSRLDDDATWAAHTPQDATEKYGVGSGYDRIAKQEDPSFVLDLADALQRADLRPDARVLDLGVNTGDELALTRALVPETPLHFVGVDHCASALEVARARFPDDTFLCADLGALPALALVPFDLVLSIGTLHSPGVDDRQVLRHVVQRLLAPGGAIIVGVPNCSYVDGEVLHGATTKNFTQPELSLLVKSVAFYRRYLQQHRMRVFVTGKNYILVTGVRMAGRP